MKRLRAILTIISVCVCGIQAQDYFMETLDKANRATPYEAVYILSDYQQFLPTFPATYYHLGVRYFDLIRAEHPIRDYYEFRQNIYRTRLYLGNCLHYAKDQNLKAIHYAGLPFAGKKPEYTDLERFIKAKLDSVAHISKLSESVYQDYYRLVNRYALCRTMFTDFAERYTREKNAHLLLSANDLAQLNQLQIQADSLQDDIRQLEASLAKFPIANYQPSFSWEEISLYRLDGLTNTNFLQNSVVLWNYGEWVRDFLKTQEQVYATYYDDIEIEYGLMQRAIEQLQAGKPCKIQEDKILLNRIDRLDYQSFMKNLLALLQQTKQIMQDGQQVILADSSKADNDYIEQAVEVLYRQFHTLQAVRQTTVSADSLSRSKYAVLLNKWGLNHTDSLAQFTKQMQQKATASYQKAATAFATNIQPGLQPFKVYINDLTGEKFSADNLQFTPEDSVVTILPVEDKYLVVLKNRTCYICSAQGNLLSTQKHAGTSHAITAYKHSSNTIAVVCTDDVLFVDRNGVGR